MSNKIFAAISLEHAQPRTPSLVEGLVREDWEVAILSPQIERDDRVKLGFFEYPLRN